MMQLPRLALTVCLLALMAGSIRAQCGPHGCAAGNAPAFGAGPMYGHSPFFDPGPGGGHGPFTSYGGIYEAIALIERPHPQVGLFPNLGWTLYPGQASSGVPSFSNYSHVNGVAPPDFYAQAVIEKLQQLGISRHPPDTKFLHKNPAIGDNLTLPTPRAWVPKLDEEKEEKPGEKIPKPKDEGKDKNGNKNPDKGTNKNSNKAGDADKEVIGRPAIESEDTGKAPGSIEKK